jgi:hypothetical protein
MAIAKCPISLETARDLPIWAYALRADPPLYRRDVGISLSCWDFIIISHWEQYLTPHKVQIQKTFALRNGARTYEILSYRKLVSGQKKVPPEIQNSGVPILAVLKVLLFDHKIATTRRNSYRWISQFRQQCFAIPKKPNASREDESSAPRKRGPQHVDANVF